MPSRVGAFGCEATEVTTVSAGTSFDEKRDKFDTPLIKLTPIAGGKVIYEKLTKCIKLPNSPHINHLSTLGLPWG